jgi:hypothetical protein
MLITWSYLAHHVISSLMHTWYWFYAYACNRCVGGSNVGGIQRNLPGGRGANLGGPASRTRGQRGGRSWVPVAQAFVVHERQAPEHSKPPTLWKQLSISMLYMYYRIKYRSCLEPLLHIYLILVQSTYLESYLGSGSSKCLALLRPVEVGDLLSPARHRDLSGHSWLYLLSWKRTMCW